MFFVGVPTVALLAALGRIYAVVLPPLALMRWFSFARAFSPRRRRDQLEELPRWELTPE